jgi:ribonuclease D
MEQSQRGVLSDMRQLVQQRAAELTVDPALLASKRELEAFIFAPPDDTPERLEGWRKPIIGDDLVTLKGQHL